MQPEFKSVFEEGTDGKFVKTGEYRGCKVVVTTSYEGRSDQWVYHVVVETKRLSELPTTWSHATKNGAFAQGFEIAKQYIDRPPVGFQNQVKSGLNSW